MKKSHRTYYTFSLTQLERTGWCGEASRTQITVASGGAGVVGAQRTCTLGYDDDIYVTDGTCITNIECILHVMCVCYANVTYTY